MTTFETGRRAEAAAAAFLERRRCRVLAQNWRTRWCEIDIVAERNNIIYFCEVKYRAHDWHGRGLDHITPKKLRQMRFAAEFWLAKYGWQGECQLCAIEVSGSDFRVTAVVKDLG